MAPFWSVTRFRLVSAYCKVSGGEQRERPAARHGRGCGLHRPDPLAGLSAGGRPHREALRHRRTRRHAGRIDAGRRPYPARLRPDGRRDAGGHRVRPRAAAERCVLGGAAQRDERPCAGLGRHATRHQRRPHLRTADAPDRAAAGRGAGHRRAAAVRPARRCSRRFSPASRSSARSPRPSAPATTGRASTRPAPSARSARLSLRPGCWVSTARGPRTRLPSRRARPPAYA